MQRLWLTIFYALAPVRWRAGIFLPQSHLFCRKIFLSAPFEARRMFQRGASVIIYENDFPSGKPASGERDIVMQCSAKAFAMKTLKCAIAEE